MRPKKSLGQNFLTSVAARQAIIRAANLGPTTEDGLPYVLEIGPGKGFLTEALLETAGKEGKVVAVEKDDLLIEELAGKFEKEIKSGQLELIHGDILDLAPRGGGQASAPWGKDYKLVANIPYNITGEIIRTFLETESQPQMMVLMLQKEVAERIVARNHHESILSISVKAYAEPRYIQTVKACSFFPKPKVDSAILAIQNISKDNFKEVSEEKFFSIVKKGFAHKRKMLRSNLNCSEEFLKSCMINPEARAEELTVKQWLYLSKNL
jgi:16S rRNA (adenine1518-N6/adenine1519-N6)-dimethyltransferase